MTGAQSDALVGVLRADGGRIRIELDDPRQRDAVVERLGYFNIEPLKVHGLPTLPESPHQVVKVSEMTSSQLKRVMRLAEAGAMPPVEPELLACMRERVEFESNWADHHPNEYRTIVLDGALDENTWPGLRAELAQHDGYPISLRTIEGFQAAAIEAGQRTGV